MLSYCLKCKKNTESLNPRVLKSRHGKTMIVSKRAICSSRKSKFIKNQEASGILSRVGIKTSLSRILLHFLSLISLSAVEKCKNKV